MPHGVHVNLVLVRFPQIAVVVNYTVWTMAPIRHVRPWYGYDREVAIERAFACMCLTYYATHEIAE